MLFKSQYHSGPPTSLSIRERRQRLNWISFALKLLRFILSTFFLKRLDVIRYLEVTQAVQVLAILVK